MKFTECVYIVRMRISMNVNPVVSVTVQWFLTVIIVFTGLFPFIPFMWPVYPDRVHTVWVDFDMFSRKQV